MQSDLNKDISCIIMNRYHKHKRQEGLVRILHSETKEFPSSADLTLRCRPPTPMEGDELLGVNEDDGGENDEDEALRWGGGGRALEEGVVLRTIRGSVAPKRIRPMAANFHNFILE